MDLPLITSIESSLLQRKGIQLDMLRIDLIHPHISGNKWFKLKYNIDFATQAQKSSLVSFGGAYSNHLHALAYAGMQAQLPTIGYVRGEEVENATLSDCKNWGMDVHFISRQNYKSKLESDFMNELQLKHPNSMIIPEGGSNELGLKGCSEILSVCDTTSYDYIAAPIGTGTTFAGIANSMQTHQHAIGFTAMKGGSYLAQSLTSIIPHTRWTLETEFAYGGFGKINEEVIELLSEFKSKHGIELDFVYTAKMMSGIMEKIEKNDFPEGSKILAIHTGGKQGNRSLA